MFSYRTLLSCGLAAVVLSGCADHSVMREDSVKRTAMPVFMLDRNVPAGDFVLKARERVYQRNQTATLYIEGDGYTHISATKVSDDPTPVDPVALRLAAQDGEPNVIWLARPCQYNKKMADGKDCSATYWTEKRFAPEVIEGYNTALNNIKAEYGIPNFNIVGYDGGAAIAVILASQRADILSLRTVAGNLDPKTTAELNKVLYSEGSLTPVDFASGVSNLPQRHFIGKLDQVIPSAVANSFAQSSGNGPCMNLTMVENADHILGWAEQWKVLKSMPLDCVGTLKAPDQPTHFDPTPLDGDKYHIKK